MAVVEVEEVEVVVEGQEVNTEQVVVAQVLEQVQVLLKVNQKILVGGCNCNLLLLCIPK